MQTSFFVRLNGNNYGHNISKFTSHKMEAMPEQSGLFFGPFASEARGIFALICARCDLPNVRPAAEIKLMAEVLEEMDKGLGNVGA